MSKQAKESKALPQVEVAAFDPSSDEVVEVQALRNVNTSIHGNIREGQKGKLSVALAEQLEALGEVKVLK